MNFSTRTNGKLLLTGEYFVTEGAVALALPTKLGQQMDVTSSEGDKGSVIWQSLNANGEVWFESTFLGNNDFQIGKTSEDGEEVAERLQKILRAARKLNPDFLTKVGLSNVKTTLEFPLDWGLGSSSTLIAMVAEWAGIDAFDLLEQTFGGSGYDIAAATANGPILFQKFNGKNRWDSSRFDPEFSEQLYFVHLNKKQNTREALVYYMVTPPDEREIPLPRITQITHDAARAGSLAEFEELLAEHEQLVQSIVKQPRAKDQYFRDFWGEIKSLGAWGGDFVLATSNRSEEETKSYFAEKGFSTVLRYDEMVKNN